MGHEYTGPLALRHEPVDRGHGDGLPREIRGRVRCSAVVSIARSTKLSLVQLYSYYSHTSTTEIVGTALHKKAH